MVADTLAGRMEVITLIPLSQAEIEGRAGRFIERAFAGDIPLQPIHPVIDGALIERVLAGGYADALGLSDVTARKYVGILERLFLTTTLQPWSGNHLSRLARRRKSTSWMAGFWPCSEG